jgi:HD-GYP domain-containing protein (c-di-GMP phosphodiesterase class II)
VRASHARRDGGGYPDGLAGEEIPLAARIIAACDTYDAIVTDRPYRPARSPLEASAELRRVAGAQLDERAVEALLAELGASTGDRPTPCG